jgi:hypothetical protein
MKKFATIIILSLLCFIECKKEDFNQSLCSSPTLISQVNSGKNAIQGLTYNSNCLVSESTEPYSYKKYSYDDRNLLYKLEVARSFNAFSCVMIPGVSLESDPRKAKISEYSDLEYDNSLRLAKKSNYFTGSGDAQLLSYQTYEYEYDRISKVSTFNPQGGLIGYNDYQYDENGNMIRVDRYSNNSGIKLVNTRVYEFDNKNNPYNIFACEGDPGKYTNRNNIIKETFIALNGTTESRSTTQNSYEYNNLDYPVRINDLACFYGK